MIASVAHNVGHNSFTSLLGNQVKKDDQPTLILTR